MKAAAEHIEEKQLPKDWKWVKLGDVCEKMSNGANAKQFEEKIGLPISRIETIWNETIDLGRVKYIEENDEAFVEKYSLKKDDILFSHINSDIHLGKTAIFKNQTKTLIHGINLLLIRLNKDALADFFNYQFKFKRRRGEFISIAQKSVNQSSINQPKLKSIEFVLPPKPTQLAIVSKIEELFSELDKGIENLRLAQQQLKTYRQSVLKWAFEGKLAKRKGEWKNVRLGDVANAIDPQPSHRTPPVVQNGVPFVSIKDFDSELDKIDFTYARRVSPDVLKEHLERYTLELGDFVIGKIGTIGKPVRVVLPQNYCLSANIVLIQPRKIDTTYLYYFFQSSLIEKAFTAGMKATTQAAFGIQKVRELRIELPNEEEQYKIVQKIESRLSVADKMEESITQSLQKAESLRQSILKKAFCGELVTS